MSGRGFRGRGRGIRPFRARGGFGNRGRGGNWGRGRGQAPGDHYSKRSRSHSRSHSHSRSRSRSRVQSRSPENKKTNVKDRLGPQHPDTAAKAPDIAPDESIRITIGNDRFKDAKVDANRDKNEKSEKESAPEKKTSKKENESRRDDSRKYPYENPRDSKTPPRRGRGRGGYERGRGGYERERGKGRGFEKLGPRVSMGLSPRRKSYSRSPDRKRNYGRRRSYSRSPGRRRSYSRSPYHRRSYSRSPDRRRRSYSRSPDRRRHGRSYSRSPDRSHSRDYSPIPRQRSPSPRRPAETSLPEKPKVSQSPVLRQLPPGFKPFGNVIAEIDQNESQRNIKAEPEESPKPDPKSLTIYDDLDSPKIRHSPKVTPKLADVFGLPQLKKEGQPLFPIIAPSVMKAERREEHEESSPSVRDHRDRLEYSPHREEHREIHSLHEDENRHEQWRESERIPPERTLPERVPPERAAPASRKEKPLIPGLGDIENVEDEDRFLYGDDGEYPGNKSQGDALYSSKLSVNPEPPHREDSYDRVYGRSRSRSPPGYRQVRDEDSHSSFGETRRVMVGSLAKPAAPSPYDSRSDRASLDRFYDRPSFDRERPPYERSSFERERHGRPSYERDRISPDRTSYERERAPPGRPDYDRERAPQGRLDYERERALQERPDYERERAPQDRPDYERDRAPQVRPDYERERAPQDRPDYERDRAPQVRPDYERERAPQRRPDYERDRAPQRRPDYERERAIQDSPGYDRDQMPEHERDRLSQGRPAHENDRASQDRSGRGPAAHRDDRSPDSHKSLELDTIRDHQPSLEKKDPEKNTDATIENILKSIGFNFELSKLMQEKARQERDEELKKNSLEAKIDKTSSFLQAGLKELGLVGDLFDKKEKKAKIASKESYEERARRYREQQMKAYAEGQASPPPFEEQERIRKEKEKQEEERRQQEAAQAMAAAHFGGTYGYSHHGQYEEYGMFPGYEGYQYGYPQHHDSFMDFPPTSDMEQMAASQRSSNLKVIQTVTDISPKVEMTKVTSCTSRTSNRTVLLPKAEQTLTEKKTITIRKKDDNEESAKPGLTQKEKEKLLKERAERQKRLNALEKELEQLRKQQNELMRKKQRLKDGHKDPLLIENSKLQHEIERQIAILRKAAEENAGSSKTKARAEEKEKSKPVLSVKPSEEVRTEEKEVTTPVRPVKEEKKTVKLLVNYVYYDPGNHWCSNCNLILTNVYDYFAHISSRKHKLKLDPYKRPWMPESLKNPPSKPKKQQTVVEALKGVEFLMSTEAYYCTLCSVFSGDQACAEHHLKSRDHNLRYQKYLDDNPFYEKSQTLEKAAQLSGRNLSSDTEEKEEQQENKRKKKEKSFKTDYEKDYEKKRDYDSDGEIDKEYKKRDRKDYDRDSDRDRRDSDRDRRDNDRDKREYDWRDSERDRREGERKRKYREREESEERDDVSKKQVKEEDVETARGGVKVAIKPSVSMQKAGFGKFQIKNLQAMKKQEEEPDPSGKISIKLAGKMVKTANPLESLSKSATSKSGAPTQPPSFMIKKLKPLPKLFEKRAINKPKPSLPEKSPKAKEAGSLSPRSKAAAAIAAASAVVLAQEQAQMQVQWAPPPAPSPPRPPVEATVPSLNLDDIPVPEEDLRDPREIEDMKLLGIESDYAETKIKAVPPPSLASSQTKPKTSMATTTGSSLYNIFFPGKETNPNPIAAPVEKKEEKEEDAASEGSDMNLGEFEIIDECSNA